jgi:hypothetical protein
VCGVTSLACELQRALPWFTASIRLQTHTVTLQECWSTAINTSCWTDVARERHYGDMPRQRALAHLMVANGTRAVSFPLGGARSSKVPTANGTCHVIKAPTAVASRHASVFDLLKISQGPALTTIKGAAASRAMARTACHAMKDTVALAPSKA